MTILEFAITATKHGGVVKVMPETLKGNLLHITNSSLCPEQDPFLLKSATLC